MILISAFFTGFVTEWTTTAAASLQVIGPGTFTGLPTAIRLVPRALDVKYLRDGEAVETFGTGGVAPGSFAVPVAVAIEPSGRIVVAQRRYLVGRRVGKRSFEQGGTRDANFATNGAIDGGVTGDRPIANHERTPCCR